MYIKATLWEQGFMHGFDGGIWFCKNVCMLTKHDKNTNKKERNALFSLY
jgi:hypothetical protein